MFLYFHKLLTILSRKNEDTVHGKILLNLNKKLPVYNFEKNLSINWA